jgi:hypothetical protein
MLLFPIPEGECTLREPFLGRRCTKVPPCDEDGDPVLDPLLSRRHGPGPEERSCGEIPSPGEKARFDLGREVGAKAG